ncbi:MFS transporter [uncultured Bacteroides sp.]|uniref:MFS transporter n=1 Tax=uncultured Bacteroides sp. TaxID=162156 RepID=UPI002AA63405|nr:MFS transporter [uncultured Bacteroides sp.]
MRNTKKIYAKLIPVMFCFFAMGFVDLVGIATNYVKADLSLTDTEANIFPSMVFFWFLIFSVPTGMLMNRIGRKKTVLLSLVVTVLALIVPVINHSYPGMLISFSLLGIGNTLMQVSLNPLISNIVSGERLASSLTLGQFVKAIASFVAPILAAWGAIQFSYWQILFPIFTVIAIIAIVVLGTTSIEEKKVEGKSSSFGECFALLGDKLILLSFLGIMCHVGIDVGTNVTAPKILIERLGMRLADAGYATSVYFLFRTIGCFSGAFILTKVSGKIFFAISVILLAIGMGGLYFVDTKITIYACVGLIGFGNSNVFSIIFSQALLHKPSKQNEVSGLMIMGLFGGTIFPLVMGIVSDIMLAQIGAVLVMTIGVVYLLLLTKNIKF